MMLSQQCRFLSGLALFSVFAAVGGVFGTPTYAQVAQFDLQGPTLEVKVQRAGKTLPIAEVPTLKEGDRLWLHPVLGEHESVHYLMVAVFLRGSTNPPPDEWFHKVEAWNKQIIEEGEYLVVPPGAEQAVVLFAPETGGDFSTLKNAVRGRPGSFVRASQDLRLASEDRDRINTYLGALKLIDDPAKVKDESNTLARSLSLKLNQDCFNRPPDQQASCLQQSQSAVVLENGSSNTSQALLNGPASDLALQAGSTPGMAAGLYDPYISAAFDIARILASFHSAQYQYIPALSSDDGLNMNLWLNSPPSFHNPKSVLVVALPPVTAANLPDLHPVDPGQEYCMQKSPLVLPVDGAPAIFATEFGHGLTLHVAGKNGKSLDLPTKADATQGGFVLPAPVLESAGLGNDAKATVRGFWGFDAYNGPSFQLRSGDGSEWKVAEEDRNALVVGRDDDLHLKSTAAACVQDVSFRDPDGKDEKAKWKADGPDGIVATLPLKSTAPGPILLSIKQYGAKSPQTVSVASFSEAGKYDAFSLHSGDADGVLTGTRLDQVASVDLRGILLMPGKLTRTGNMDTLALAAPQPDAQPAAKATAAKPAKVEKPSVPLTQVTSLAPDTESIAQITLKDGRIVPVPVKVEQPRPRVAIINTLVQTPPVPQPVPAAMIKLTTQNELPMNGKLTFALKSQSPATFSKGESIEVATIDGISSVTYSLASGDLVLQDAKTAIATLDPAQVFRGSAFGPLHLRAILADGTTGNWLPLATLVRLPAFASYSCPPEAGPGQPCTLTGDRLFLLAAVSSDPSFTNPVAIPDGFAASSIQVPRANNGQLFARLRDNPDVINNIAVEMPKQHIAHHAPHIGPPAPAQAVPTDTAPAGATTTPAASGSTTTPPPAPPTTTVSPSPIPATTAPAANSKTTGIGHKSR
jgi:hypothetical protein